MEMDDVRRGNPRVLDERDRSRGDGKQGCSRMQGRPDPFLLQEIRRFEEFRRDAGYIRPRPTPAARNHPGFDSETLHPLMQPPCRDGRTA